VHAEAIVRAIHAMTSTPATVTILARHSDPLREPAWVHIALHGDTSAATATKVTRDVPATTNHLALALNGQLIPR
jgi:hypothetical protein